MLNINASTDFETAKKSYKKQAKSLHPDKHLLEIEKYTELSMRLNEAWALIKKSYENVQIQAFFDNSYTQSEDAYWVHENGDVVLMSSIPTAHLTILRARCRSKNDIEKVNRLEKELQKRKPTISGNKIKIKF